MDKAPSGPSDSKLVSAVSGKVPNHKHIASKNANEYKSFKYIEDYKKAKNNLINIKINYQVVHQVVHQVIHQVIHQVNPIIKKHQQKQKRKKQM